MRNKNQVSAVVIFCEDIRQEANGMHTIIGTFRDNLAGSRYPGQMARLGVYMRANFPIADIPRNLSLRLETPWSDTPISLGGMGEDALNKAHQTAKDDKSEILGVVMTAVISPFMAQREGRMNAVLTIDGVDQRVGFLNFVTPKAQGSSDIQEKKKLSKAKVKKNKATKV